jgi:hypothetical protein
MPTNGSTGERSEGPSAVPEAFPVCRPEREDSIVPLLVVGAVALLIQRVRRWRARRRAKLCVESFRRG